MNTVSNFMNELDYKRKYKSFLGFISSYLNDFLYKNKFVIYIFLVGVGVSYFMIDKSKRKELERLRNRINVLSDHFQLLNHWLEIKNEGKSIASYFEEMGYYHIAIYGMAELANRISEELCGSSISVDYGIDRDICCSISRIGEVYFPEDNLPPIDVIVVTPYSSFKTIKEILKKRIDCPIVSLEEVIWSV